MKFFFNRKTTRYTAIVMLFVWLMTVGIGFANACLVSAEQAHHGSAIQVQAVPPADVHAMDSDKLACLTVCAADQSAAVKMKSLEVTSDSQTIPVAWPPVLTTVLVDRNDRSTPLMLAPWCEPPVSIRFLRLTI